MSQVGLSIEIRGILGDASSVPIHMAARFKPTMSKKARCREAIRTA